MDLDVAKDGRWISVLDQKARVLPACCQAKKASFSRFEHVKWCFICAIINVVVRIKMLFLQVNFGGCQNILECGWDTSGVHGGVTQTRFWPHESGVHPF
jgi:hypothetical protein